MTATAHPTKIRMKVLRQQDKEAPSHWETFEIPFVEKLNVISALMAVQKNPVTQEGKTVRPPSWDAACLEEVCGSCTMNINGRIRQACTALIEEIGDVVGRRVRGHPRTDEEVSRSCETSWWTARRCSRT